MLAFDVHDLAERWRDLSTALVRTCLGAIFVALAVIAIEYDETVAPGLNRFLDSWSTSAGSV